MYSIYDPPVKISMDMLFYALLMWMSLERIYTLKEVKEHQN